MSKWIEELSSRESQAKAQTQRIAMSSHRIFADLRKLLLDGIGAYNAQHPQPSWAQAAVTVLDRPFDSASFGIELFKHNPPDQTPLQIEFPINSGALTFSSQGVSGTITIGLENDDVHFDIGKRRFTTETLAEFLLKPFLFPEYSWNTLRAEVVDRFGQADHAATALEAVELHTAARELREADADLVKTPPDLTGAIQHAIAALECVARKYTNDKGTFGKLLERHPNLFPKPLDVGIEKMWGFASDTGRHLQEGREPEKDEAELLVGLAIVGCTYLARKIG